MEKIATLIGLAMLVGAGSFWGYDYQFAHKPAFEALADDYQCTRCMDDCMEFCKANNRSWKECNCSHCDKFCR